MQSNDAVLTTLPTDDRLADRTVVVTGATSGIGAATARVLAASGARVLLTGRDADRGEAVVAAITASGGEASFLTADLAGSAQVVEHFAHDAVDALGGRVDALVNNAGIYPVGPTGALAVADLEAMLRVNVLSPYLLVAELAPAMAERGHGAVVNVGSWMARVGVPFGAMYTASKAALEQMTRSWAAEFGPRGVRVNTVAPGATLTEGNVHASQALDQMTSTTVVGRPVRPVDVAYAVRFLVSDEAAFVHGTSLDVDGGITTTRLG